MAGRSAVAEVMDGAGPVSEVAAELRRAGSRHGRSGPRRRDGRDRSTRYGEVQARFEELDGYALEGRAREVLAGLSFSQEMMDGDVGALSGGWKMRVALARILLMRPDAMLLDEPSNHLDLESLIWLEQFLKGYEGALLMTSHDREFMNRIVNKIVEIDGGALTTYSGDYEFYEQQRALNEKQQQAQFERQQAMLAKEIKFIERFKARASHAAQVQSRVKKLEKIERVEPPERRQTVDVRVPAGAALGRGRRQPEERAQGAMAAAASMRGWTSWSAASERWCVMGVNGAGKSTLLKLDRPVRPSRTTGTRCARRQRQDGLLRAARHGPARRRAHGVRGAGGCVSAGRAGLAARARRLLRLLRRRRREALPRAVGRRKGAAGDGEDAVRSAELPGARTSRPTISTWRPRRC